jgi:hypothetical protein
MARTITVATPTCIRPADAAASMLRTAAVRQRMQNGRGDKQSIYRVITSVSNPTGKLSQ